MIQAVPKSAALGLVALAQLIIFAFIGFISYERTLDEERDHLAVDARATAEQIAQAMRQVEIELAHLVKEVERHGLRVDEYSNAALSALTGVTSASPYIGGAGFADAGGTVRVLVLSENQKVVSGPLILDRAYFTVQRDNKAEGIYLSDPVLGRIENKWILIASRRLSAPDGTFLGITMVSVNPDYFASAFALERDRPIRRRVVTNKGAVIATAGRLEGDPATAPSDQPIQIAPEQIAQEGFFWAESESSADTLTAVAPVPGWPLVATASMSSSEVFADLWTDLIGLGLVLTASLGALLALVINFYRHQQLGSEHERRFKSLIEDANDGVVIHDVGMVLFANDATAQILGLSHGSEMRGRTLTDFIPEEMHSEARTRWRAVKESGQPTTERRAPGHRVDGKTIYMDVTSQQIEWGDKLAIRSSLVEVTEQVLLAKRDERRTAILAAVNDAHSIYLNQTRNRGAFEELLEKILGLSGSVYGLIAEKVEEEEGKPFLRSLAISDISWDEETRRWYESAASGGMEFRNIDNLRGEPLRNGKILIANDPRKHPASTGVPCGHLAMDNLMILPLTLEDEILGEVALANRPGGFDEALAEELGPIVQAITRIVSDYRSARLREAAEQASRSKSAFLAHMSHELRTPLAGVIANLELLSDTTLEREQADLVEASMGAGKGLLGVIGNTLDFSKIEADELMLDMIEFDPGTMVENVQSIFSGAAQDKGLTVTTVVDALVPRKVIADELRLRQVIANLVGNSIKFTDSGRIVISLSAQRINDGRAQLCISVDDTGIGFDPEKAENLFKPYGQETSATARSFGGTGLGLTIAQRLIELHDGEINCYAEPGKGSSFLASFPVPVVEWGATDVRPMADQNVTLLFPAGGLPDDVIPSLQAAGAVVHNATQVEALLPILSERTERQRTLLLDWKALDPEQQDMVACADNGFDQTFAATTNCNPNGRRQALFFNEIKLIAKPLCAINISHAIHGNEATRSARRADQAQSGQTGYQVFEPGQAPRILVVEDQPMNQLVLKRQLRRLGIDCDLAENGREALTLLEDSEYDIVITDCSMPVMDGFEFSMALRALEAAGRPRSAIIALTANAVTGDAQRCYDAGMDAYLSKPVGLSELSTALEQWWHPSMRQAETKPVEPAPLQEPQDAPPIDRAGIAELIGDDDAETIDALILDFFENWQTSLSALHGPLQQGDTAALCKAAHAAKGTARYGMAAILADTCESLEKLTAGEELQGADKLIEALETETGRLKAYLGKAGLIRDDERQSA
ncbi:response regulator [Pelagibius litoralis]|uniref:histidine kinase n=1 Tax=Pelagibius litoralis TaxID=374515 RepID=A0A967KFU0_9PROT|nr:ATP-binding protein [Pelagibius litoralis]NIA69811.1 response regulator [Pelagibius litoralis]